MIIFDKQMNRCIGLNSSRKRCRTRLEGDSLICCEAHSPKNSEILEFCPICCKSNLKSSEICTLSCNHSFHKECLREFLDLSEKKYECPYCRENGIKPKIEKKSKKMTFQEKFIIESCELHKIIFNLNSVKYA